MSVNHALKQVCFIIYLSLMPNVHQMCYICLVDPAKLDYRLLPLLIL